MIDTKVLNDLAAIISTLTEAEKQKLYYIAQGIKIANEAKGGENNAASDMD